MRTVDDVSKVDPKTQAIRIAHTVGIRKRVEISVRAGERGVHVLNPLPEITPEEEAEKEAPKETEAEGETKETMEKEEEEEEKKG